MCFKYIISDNTYQVSHNTPTTSFAQVPAGDRDKAQTAASERWQEMDSLSPHTEWHELVLGVLCDRLYHILY